MEHSTPEELRTLLFRLLSPEGPQQADPPTISPESLKIYIFKVKNSCTFDQLKQLIRSINTYNTYNTKLLLLFWLTLATRKSMQSLEDTLNNAWRTYFVLLEKLIVTHTSRPENESIEIKNILFLALHSLIDHVCVNPITELQRLQQTLNKMPSQSFPPLKGDLLNISLGSANLVKVYACLLCLNQVEIQEILTLTLRLIELPRVQAVLKPQLYKLNIWLGSKSKYLDLKACKLLFNIVTKNVFCEQLSRNDYNFDPNRRKGIYHSLLESLIRGLSEINSKDSLLRDELFIGLIERIVPGVESAYEFLLEALSREQSITVVKALLGYTTNILMDQISAKNLKLLIRNFSVPQSSIQNESALCTQLFKLKSYTSLLKQIVQRYVEKCIVLDFLPDSLLVVENMGKFKDFTLMINFQIKPLFLGKIDLLKVTFKKFTISLYLKRVPKPADQQNDHSGYQMVFGYSIVSNGNKKTLIREENVYHTSQHLLCIVSKNESLSISHNSQVYDVKEARTSYIVKLEVGKLSEPKGSNSGGNVGFKGRVKHLMMFDESVAGTSLYKEWAECDFKFYMLLRKIGTDKLILKMSRGDSLFRGFRQASLLQRVMGRSTVSFKSEAVDRIPVPSVLEVLEQSGHLDCLLYFIQHINSTIPSPKDVLPILEQFFSVLKYICINDEFSIGLDWLENSLASLAHLLWLIFSRNTEAAQSERLTFKILDFFLSLQKRLKSQSHMDEILFNRLKVLNWSIIRSILLNFDIWSICGPIVQLFIFKVLEQHLKDHAFLENLLVRNQLNTLLLALAVHYSSPLMTELQNYLLHVIGSVLRNMASKHAGLCVDLILQYIYVIQEPDLRYPNVEVQNKLLVLFSSVVLKSSMFVPELVAGIQVSHQSARISLMTFFCYLIENCLEISTYQLLLNIQFKLLDVTHEQQYKLIFHILEALRKKLAKTREFDFKVCTYFSKLITAVLNNARDHKSRERVLVLVLDYYQISLKAINNPQTLYKMICLDLTQTPTESLVYFVNQVSFFKGIKTQLGNRFTETIQKILLIIVTLQEPIVVIDFLEYVLTIQQISLADVVANERDKLINIAHIWIEYFPHYPNLLKLLHKHHLITCETPIKFSVSVQTLPDSVPDTLLHILSTRNLSIDDITLLTDTFAQLAEFPIEQWAFVSGEHNQLTILLPHLLLSQLLQLNYCSSQNKQSLAQVLELVRKLILSQQTSQTSILKAYSHFSACKQEINKFSLLLQQKRNQSSLELLKSRYVAMNVSLRSQFTDNKQSQPLLETLLGLLADGRIQEVRVYLQENEERFKQMSRFMREYSTKDILVLSRLQQYAFWTPQESLQIKGSQDIFPLIESSDHSHLLFKLKYYQRNFEKSLAELDSSNEQAEETWRKLVSRSMAWMLNQKAEDEIYKMDMYQSPNLYHLNLKPVRAVKFAKYPRRNQNPEEQHEVIVLQRKESQLNGGSFLKMTDSGSFSVVSQKKRIQNKSLPAVIVQERGQTMESVVKRDSKVAQSFYSEYVTQRGVYFGIITANDHYLYFKTIPQDEIPTDRRQYTMSTSKFHKLKEPKTKKIEIVNNGNSRTTVQTRRYVMRHTAFQVYSKKKSYFFNLFFEQKRRDFLNLIKNKCYVVNNRKQEFLKLEYTKKWLNGELNNFEYLMWVNRYSGRTYHDLGQYPVFPWVISNYSVPVLTKQVYKQPQNLRNLELPMGKINKTRFEGFKTRMLQIGKEVPESYFLYGTFYSNPTVLYNFFIRMEPFTTLHWEHQGQKIDHADRLFSGIEEQYKSATNNSSDVKEIIPEFYYWPEFLRNRNQVVLGKKQNQEQVNNIKLPAWAKTPEEFVFKMRQVLESPWVTQKLHVWIDLVFGYKASPPSQAELHDNLFHPMTYEQDIFKLEEDYQVQVAQMNISQFGQVPQGLFVKEHPAKIPRKGIKLDHYQLVGNFPCANKIFTYKQGIMLSGPNQTCFISTYLSIVLVQTDIRKFDSVGNRYSMYGEKQMVWLSTKDKTMYYYNRKEIDRRPVDSEIFVLLDEHILARVSGATIIVESLKPGSLGQSQVIGKLYGHQDDVYVLEASPSLDVLLSVDLDHLVLLHFVTGLRHLRHFKLKMLSGETIRQARIHDMGYFLFLTSMGRVMVYTFMGEEFLSSDLVTECEGEQITNFQIFSDYQSLILFSTNLGNIYQVDFFQAWNFRQQFPHLPYRLRARRNILAPCISEQHSKGECRYGDSTNNPGPIVHFEIMKCSNEYKGLFKMLVLYESGRLLYFYEKSMIKEQLQNSPILKQLGLV